MTKRVRISTLSAFLASVFAAGGLALAGGNNGDGARAVSGTNGNSLDTPFQAQARAFNRPGDVLISDQFNNRVIEIDSTGKIVWSLGLGPNDVSASSIVGVNDAQRVGVRTLMAGTGAPPGTEPGCPSGRPDNRVILVNPAGHIEWQYGQFGVTGDGPNELNTPVQATWLPNGHVLITDQFNHRVIVVDRAKNIVTSWGTLNTPGYGTSNLNQGLNGPYDAKVVGDFTGLTPPHRSDHDADEPADGDLR